MYTGTLSKNDLVQLEKVALMAPEGELVARQLFTIDSSIHPGAETVGYDVLTRMGSAKIIANGDTALPLVDTDKERKFTTMHSLAAGAEFTAQEMRAAQMAGQNVETDKVSAARRAISELEDKLIFRGNTEHGIEGALNAEGILTTAADKTIATSTPEEMLEMLRKARVSLTKQTGFSGAPLVLVLPQEQYEIMAAKRYSDYDARTVLQVVESYNWFKKIVPTNAVRGGGEGGADAALIFNSAPEVAKILLAFDITMLPQENYATYTKLGLEERTGGLQIKVPNQFVRIDNV